MQHPILMSRGLAKPVLSCKLLAGISHVIILVSFANFIKVHMVWQTGHAEIL